MSEEKSSGAIEGKPFNTGRTVAVWPKLHEPDYGSEKYPDKMGSFRTKWRMEADAARAFLAKLEPTKQAVLAWAEEQFAGMNAAQRRKLGSVTFQDPFTEELDKETEEPTGAMLFSAKRRYSFIYKSGQKKGQTGYMKLPVFDSFGERVVKVPKLYSGSLLNMTVKPRGYFVSGSATAGISFDLEAVQIIRVQSGSGGKNADEYGFGNEGDGYGYEPTDEDETETAPKGEDAAPSDQSPEF